jgi:hypothetical protein
MCRRFFCEFDFHPQACDLFPEAFQFVALGF